MGVTFVGFNPVTVGLTLELPVTATGALVFLGAGVLAFPSPLPVSLILVLLTRVRLMVPCIPPAVHASFTALELAVG